MGTKIQKDLTSHLPIWTSIVVLLSIAAYVVPELYHFFIYDRIAILSGEVWRLWSSHLIHFNTIHLLYNILVFGVSGWIIESKGYDHFGLLCILIAFFIGIFLMLMEPAMRYYGGLSGLACGSIYYLALFGLSESKFWRRFSLLILFIVPIKIFFEIFSNESILPYADMLNFITMPLSHILGILTASFLFFTIKISKKRQNNPENIIEDAAL